MSRIINMDEEEKLTKVQKKKIQNTTVATRKTNVKLITALSIGAIVIILLVFVIFVYGNDLSSMQINKQNHREVLAAAEGSAQTVSQPTASNFKTLKTEQQKQQHIVTSGSYAKMTQTNNWVKITLNNATHCQVVSLIDPAVQMIVPLSKLTDITNNHDCMQHIDLQELFKSNIMETMNKYSDSSSRAELIDEDYVIKKTIDQFMRGVDSPSWSSGSMYNKQIDVYHKKVENVMRNYEEQIGSAIHDARITHPFFQEFINKYNWLYPLIIYATETNTRVELFKFMKNVNYNDVLDGTHFFEIGSSIVPADNNTTIKYSHKLNIFSFLSVFLYSIAIQKKSNLKEIHLQEFIDFSAGMSDVPGNELHYNEIWSLEDLPHWIWSLEYDHLKRKSNVADDQFKFIFRGLFIPISSASEYQLAYTQNMQSFSMIPDGVESILRFHQTKMPVFGDDRKYKIVIVIGPLQLIGWRKLTPLRFPYSYTQSFIAYQEKEVIMPPFTKYSWIQVDSNPLIYIDNEGNVGLNECVSQVIDQWNMSSKNKEFLSTNMLKTVKGLRETKGRHKIEFRFIDHRKSRIAEWKDWYKLILP